MFHFLGFVTLLVNVVVVASLDLSCVQKYINEWPRYYGFSVLPINFQSEDVKLITDLKGVSKDIKFVDQKFHTYDAYPCTDLTYRHEIKKCVELHFEAFGEKYVVLAGLYTYYGQWPYMWDEFSTAKCQKGWNYDHRQADQCQPDYFQFLTKKLRDDFKCGNEQLFVVAVPIPKKYCVSHMIEEIRSHSRGLIGRVFGLAGEPTDSPHNDKNIVKVGWKMFGPDDKICTFLERSKHPDNQPKLKDCRFLQVTIYGKPFSVFYGNGFYWEHNTLLNNPDSVQCQEGHELNPAKFFPCSAERGITFHVSPDIECYQDHSDTVIGIGAPRK